MLIPDYWYGAYHAPPRGIIQSYLLVIISLFLLIFRRRCADNIVYKLLQLNANNSVWIYLVGSKFTHIVCPRDHHTTTRPSLYSWVYRYLG